MTVSDVALPHGTPVGADSVPQRGARRTRTRARVDVTARHSKTLARVAQIPVVVWSDWRNSWVRVESTPSWATYIETEKTRPVPGDDVNLRRARIGWAYTAGSFGTLSGHLWAWLWQSPLRLLTAGLMVAVPVLVWQLGGAG